MSSLLCLGIGGAVQQYSNTARGSTHNTQAKQPVSKSVSQSARTHLGHTLKLGLESPETREAVEVPPFLEEDERVADPPRLDVPRLHVDCPCRVALESAGHTYSTYNTCIKVLRTPP